MHAAYMRVAQCNDIMHSALHRHELQKHLQLHQVRQQLIS